MLSPSLKTWWRQVSSRRLFFFPQRHAIWSQWAALAVLGVSIMASGCGNDESSPEPSSSGPRAAISQKNAPQQPAPPDLRTLFLDRLAVMDQEYGNSSAFAFYAQSKSSLRPHNLNAIMTDAVVAAASGWDEASSPTILAKAIADHEGSLELLRAGTKADRQLLPNETDSQPVTTAFLNVHIQDLLPLGALLAAEGAMKAANSDVEGARADAWAALKVGDDLQIDGVPLPMAMAGTSLESYGADLLLRLGGDGEMLSERLANDRDPSRAWAQSLPMMTVAAEYLSQLPKQIPAKDEETFGRALRDLETQFGSGRFAEMTREEFDAALEPEALKALIGDLRSAAETVATARNEHGGSSPESEQAMTAYRDTLTSAVAENPFVMVVAPPRLAPIVLLGDLVRSKLQLAIIANTVRQAGGVPEGGLQSLDLDARLLIDPVTDQPFQVTETEASEAWVISGPTMEDLAARGLMPETIANYLPLGMVAVRIEKPSASE